MKSYEDWQKEMSVVRAQLNLASQAQRAAVSRSGGRTVNSAKADKEFVEAKAKLTKLEAEESEVKAAEAKARQEEQEKVRVEKVAAWTVEAAAKTISDALLVAQSEEEKVAIREGAEQIRAKVKVYVGRDLSTVNFDNTPTQIISSKLSSLKSKQQQVQQKAQKELQHKPALELIDKAIDDVFREGGQLDMQPTPMAVFLRYHNPVTQLGNVIVAQLAIVPNPADEPAGLLLPVYANDPANTAVPGALIYNSTTDTLDVCRNDKSWTPVVCNTSGRVIDEEFRVKVLAYAEERLAYIRDMLGAQKQEFEQYKADQEIVIQTKTQAYSEAIGTQRALVENLAAASNAQKEFNTRIEQRLDKQQVDSAKHVLELVSKTIAASDDQISSHITIIGEQIGSLHELLSSNISIPNIQNRAYEAGAAVQSAIINLLEDAASAFTEIDKGIALRSLKQIYASIIAADNIVSFDIEAINQAMAALNASIPDSSEGDRASVNYRNTLHFSSEAVRHSVSDLITDFAKVFNRIDDAISDQHLAYDALNCSSGSSSVSGADGANSLSATWEYL